MDDSRSGDLLERWRNGDQCAATELFRRYADRLIALARRRLPARLAQRIDPEDVVQSVYRCFFADARAGRFELQRGGDLWHLLVSMTFAKLYNQIGRNDRAKRAAGREQLFGTEEGLLALQASQLAQEPSPMDVLAVTDQLERLMRPLEPTHRRILELRLQGFTLEEIATATERSERTVRRVLEQIKEAMERAHRQP